jgi:hypothetical protein
MIGLGSSLPLFRRLLCLLAVCVTWFAVGFGLLRLMVDHLSQTDWQE